MTTEVLRAVAEGAVKTAMSIEPMVKPNVDVGLIVSVVALVIISAVGAVAWSIVLKM